MQRRVLDMPEIVKIGEKYGKSAVHVTLRYLLQLDIIVIPKSAKQERIETNKDVFDFELTDEEMQVMRSLDAGERVGPHPDEFGK